MKRLLLLAYYFPPQPEAGAIRTGAIARYLPEFGWTVTVISLAGFGNFEFAGEQFPARNILVPALGRNERSSPAASVNAASKPSLKALVPAGARRAYWKMLQSGFPDSAMGWIPSARRIARRLQSECRFDAVLSSAHPASSHLVAYDVANRSRVPWIADYRDLWTGNPYSRKPQLRRWVERRLEQWVVSRAAAITTVSPALADDLRTLFPACKVVVIPNGVEPPVNGSTPDGVVPRSFHLLFAGSLYGGRRSPEPIFAAIRSLREAGHPAGMLTFDFYGEDEADVRRLAARYGLDDVVKAYDRVDRNVILDRERRAAVLVILLSMDNTTTQEYGSKVFEYANARRPILAIGPHESVLRTYLRETGLGQFATDAESCARALMRAYERFQWGEYEPALKAGWSPYTTRDLAERFAQILDEAVR